LYLRRGILLRHSKTGKENINVTRPYNDFNFHYRWSYCCYSRIGAFGYKILWGVILWTKRIEESLETPSILGELKQLINKKGGVL